MLVPFAITSVGPLQVVTTITLDRVAKCIAVNDVTNRVYIGVEDGLTIIDGETDTVITEILPETNVVALAVNPQTNYIYAAVYGEKIVVIDGTTNQVVGEISGGIYNQYAIAINPVTNLLYLGEWRTIQGYYDCILVYDGQTLTEITQVNIPASFEHTIIERVGVTVNPETNRIYVANERSDNISVIDGATDSVVATIEVGEWTAGIDINPKTNKDRIEYFSKTYCKILKTRIFSYNKAICTKYKLYTLNIMGV